VSDGLDGAKADSVRRTGLDTSEFKLTVVQLLFAGFAMYLGRDDVAMVALASAGLYPISRAVVKR